MSTDAPALAWDWEDPQGIEAVVDSFTADLGKCEKLELLLSTDLITREQLEQLGITGIEFAAFKTDHPQALGTDLVSVSSPELTSERGHIYRVDGSAFFAEMDISQTLPVVDDAVDWVYAEHLIEHVSMKIGIAWLKEVKRVLKPGGFVRITTPDLKIYAQSYVNGDGFFGKHRRRVDRALTGVAPKMPPRGAFMFNQLFYVYGHRWIYDLEELQHVLMVAGFDPEGIAVRAYRDGARQDVADLDQVLRNDESIYLEATA
jgi:predicted SAM-dependent methyltransferase